MALSSGTKLGPYEIQWPLGVGGMGEVYRARDTRLGRQVTLKFLPDEASKDRQAMLDPRLPIACPQRPAKGHLSWPRNW